uniref:Methionine aminopeptidase n=1 Tax=uncultured actinobacterium Rifle_16ft_4_minimus_550 TaxID=1665149 RepID=A0A0H4TUD1_9ACTN|nr:methionine aminopeptidase, methionyl aminopeptidase [uncultured actinobacterium Rifle_16ft_4_minimus_550]
MIAQRLPHEIRKIQRAGRIVAETLEIIKIKVKPGITPKELEELAEAHIQKRGGKPAFKGYQNFPASICVSVNEGVVHGIPGHRKLEQGDIVSIDVGVKYEGYYGDAAITLPVGEVTNGALRLIDVTKQALDAGVWECRVGNRLSDISHAIEIAARDAGLSVVKDFVGHGIGQLLHEEPQIPNYGPANRGPLLKEGMVFALEPMVNAGGPEIEILPDHWSVVTKDRSLSAHFEHTVAVTLQGPKILTAL